MDVSEAKKLAETVEAGLRDGRPLDSLRKAMKGSGYEDDEIREVLSHVDRKNIARKPPKKKARPAVSFLPIAAGLVILVIIGVSAFWKGSGPATPGGSNTTGATPPIESKICYVMNETVKEKMISAGAKCDKWYLIEEISGTSRSCYVTDETVRAQMERAGTMCDVWYYLEDLPNLPYSNTSMTCYVLNETVKEEMIRNGARCSKWFLIEEI